MANKYWTPKIEKISVSLGMATTGYYLLSQAFAQLPKLPLWVSKPILMSVSPLIIAAGLTVYGVIMLWQKY